MLEQAVLAPVVLLFGATGLLYLLDWASEQIDDYLVREKQWKSIEMRCSRERHPSYRAPLFDQDEWGVMN